MLKYMDLLLINSLAPRQRVVSDAALENGLVLLRTHLQHQGFHVEVIDEQRVSHIEQGVPHILLNILRCCVKWQLKLKQNHHHILLAILIVLVWPLQALTIYYRKLHLQQTINHIIRRVKTENISLVGIKLWYGDSFVWSKTLAKQLKQQCPNTVVIVGGPQVKVYGEYVLHDHIFDYGIMGPGEFVLEDMLRTTATFAKDIPVRQQFLQHFQQHLIKTGGYTTAKQTRRTQVIPEYQTEDLTGKLLFHTLVDGYGCTWNRCLFCSHTRHVQCYQPRDIDGMIQEITYMNSKGIRFFRFSSSETPVGHGSNIAAAILKHQLNIHYSMFIRAATVNAQVYDAYRLMIRSGLRAVFMGCETGHDLINQVVMNKGVSAKNIIDTVNCIKLAAAAEGQPCRIGLSFIYPCPVVDGVTLQDILAANLKLIQETGPDTVIVNPPGVFPGTVWFQEPERFGFAFQDDLIYKLMEYEYSIYKPAEWWDQLNISLNGMDTTAILNETGRLRTAVLDMGIPTDISDEYLMMTQAIGYRSTADLLKFKYDSLLDIMSGCTDYTQQVVNQINNVCDPSSVTNK